MHELSLTRHFDLPPFSAVDVAADVSATIVSGPARQVTASAAHEEAFSRLTLEVRDDTLFASAHHGFLGLGWSGAGPVHLHIAAPRIERVVTDAGARGTRDGAAMGWLEFPADAGSNAEPGSTAGADQHTGVDRLARVG